MTTSGHADERTHLLASQLHNRRLSALHDEEAHSIISSHVSKEEAVLGDSTIGERLPYNDYTTIDWLHDFVGAACRFSSYPNDSVGEGLLPMARTALTQRTSRSASFHTGCKFQLVCSGDYGNMHGHRRLVGRYCSSNCV